MLHDTVEAYDTLPLSQKMNFLTASNPNEYEGYASNSRKEFNKQKNEKRTIRDHRRGKVDKRTICI